MGNCFSVSVAHGKLCLFGTTATLIAWVNMQVKKKDPSKHACRRKPEANPNTLTMETAAPSSSHLQLGVKRLLTLTLTQTHTNTRMDSPASSVRPHHNCVFTVCVCVCFTCLCGSSVHSLWRVGKKNGDVSNYITDFAANLR